LGVEKTLGDEAIARIEVVMEALSSTIPSGLAALAIDKS